MDDTAGQRPSHEPLPRASGKTFLDPARLEERLLEREAVRPHEFGGYIRGLQLTWNRTTPQRIVELGTYVGNSTFAWLSQITRLGGGGIVYTIDTDPRNLQPLRDDIKEFGWEKHVVIVQADSIEFAKGGLPIDPVDMVYVDTTHEYLQTRREIEAWLPHIRSGGFLLLDDVIGYPEVLKAFSYCLEVSCRGNFDVCWLFTRPPHTPESHGLLVAKLR